MSKHQLKNRRLTSPDGQENAVVSRRLRRFLVASTGVFGAVLLIVSSIYFGAQSVRNTVDRPVAKISVESDFNYVRRQDIMSLINNTLDQSFLYENLHKIKTELEKSAWIDNVILSRQWPDHLQVKIIEQVPIARWADVGFINHRGERILVSDAEELQHLPHLAGPLEDSLEVLKQYQTISKLLRKYDFEITRLVKSEHHRWMIELANGWQINIGEGQLMEKMQRFVVVLKDQLLPYRDSIAIIDMRYQHGVAVKWLESEKVEPVLQTNSLLSVGGI